MTDPATRAADLLRRRIAAFSWFMSCDPGSYQGRDAVIVYTRAGIPTHQKAAIPAELMGVKVVHHRISPGGSAP